MSREHFYRRMAWVVDMTRTRRDFKRFQNAVVALLDVDHDGYCLTPVPHEILPINWVHRKVPVLFDFGIHDASTGQPDFTKHLWCIWPGRLEGHALLRRMPLELFLAEATQRGQIQYDREFVRKIGAVLEMRRREQVAYVPQFWNRSVRPKRRYARF